MAFHEDAPAKLNLALHVRARRPDGYHELETLFAFTDFGDSLTAAPAEGLSLTVTGPYAAAAGTGDDNLVIRAAAALAAGAGVPANAALTLDKRIPVAAGLGGGSADAAAALRLLNRMWRIDWPESWLESLAVTLGADVPACVRSRPSLGRGRGERLYDWPSDLGGTPLLLVNPRVAVPTGPVFAAWDGMDHGRLDPDRPLDRLRNDLTAPAIAIAPVIAEVLAALENAGNARLIRMSGSGATCFALYDSPSARDDAAAALAPRNWWLAPTSLR
jgi:4-diphosphocytidyl-2-C-methyl-D-erythritol kinase